VSTRKSAPEETPEGWERINVFALRMVVPGGWIYDIAGRGLVFVPEPVCKSGLVPLFHGGSGIDESV
jgi:hypothetical protein